MATNEASNQGLSDRGAANGSEPERLEQALADARRLSEALETAALENKQLTLEAKVRSAEIRALRKALERERDLPERQRNKVATRERVQKSAQRHDRRPERAERAPRRPAAEPREQIFAMYLDALSRRRGRTAWRLLVLLLRFRLRDVSAYFTIRRSQRFDARFYLMRYPEVAVAGENPILDYIERGAADGRNPSRDFDTAAYVAEHPELAETGENPLVHLLRREREAKEVSP